MENFEDKLTKANKSLENIRGVSLKKIISLQNLKVLKKIF